MVHGTVNTSSDATQQSDTPQVNETAIVVRETQYTPRPRSESPHKRGRQDSDPEHPTVQRRPAKTIAVGDILLPIGYHSVAGSAAESREAQKSTAVDLDSLKKAYATLAIDVAKSVADQAAIRDALVQGQNKLFERNAEALEELTRVNKSLVEAHQKADYQEKLLKDSRTDYKERRVVHLRLQKQSDARILALEEETRDLRQILRGLDTITKNSSGTSTATSTPMFSLVALRAEVEKQRVFKVEMSTRVVALEKRVEEELSHQGSRSRSRKPENVREKTFTNIVDNLKAEIAEVRRATEVPSTKTLDKGKGKDLRADPNTKDKAEPAKPAVRILRRPVVPAVPVIAVKSKARQVVDDEEFQLVEKETVVPKLYPTS